MTHICHQNVGDSKEDACSQLDSCFSPSLWKAIYLKHNAAVMQLAPKDQLLVYNSKEGWGPLCKFLGVEIPSTPMPHENKAVKAQLIHDVALFSVN